VSLKQDIERQTGIPVKLRAGMPGALDVYWNGAKIYSKAQTGRLPTTADLLPLIAPTPPSS
jgi:hypothetical protein